MKTIFITGNHPRHIYLVKKFTKFFKNFNWIIEKRDININHQKLLKSSSSYKKHIKNFKSNEKKFFKSSKNFEEQNQNRIRYISRKKINSTIFNSTILNHIKKYKPRVLFSYGCQKIDVTNLKNLKIKCFNIHGGLLPKYKGVNTNFWPHMNNESNMIGLTLHKLDEKIDSGDIFFQTSVDIEKKDTINSLSCKAIINFCDFTPKKIFSKIKINPYVKGIRFKSKHKLYRKVDFKASDLKKAYKNLKTYLNSKKIKKKPRLININ